MIEAGIRKNYRREIRKSCSEHVISVMDNQNYDKELFFQFRELHKISSGGKSRRSIVTWQIMEKALKAGSAFLVTAKDINNHEFRGGSFIFTSPIEALYGIGAYDRDHFNIAIVHGCIWTAICTAKLKGTNYFNLGFDNSFERSKGDVDKLKNIAFFKSGFCAESYLNYIAH